MVRQVVLIVFTAAPPLSCRRRFATHFAFQICRHDPFSGAAMLRFSVKGVVLVGFQGNLWLSRRVLFL
ncbi:hypothetical protein MtrunA17_Chr4g0062861 [Medicago truncatula]|uniref:Uncharacterized protein n=1 Tax=Medicago truncatula TaxID=3880 RepID=A0A396IE53_MEDTR|nr:hypothetical protein MtrunA17_Chr4g0062861 [Medicago truncatula]